MKERHGENRIGESKPRENIWWYPSGSGSGDDAVSKAQREKGKVGEREWVQVLKSHGYDAKRSAQHKGNHDSADVIVIGPIANWEVKRREAMSLHPVVAQARAEAGGALSAVAWRKDGGRWVVAMDAEDFFRVLRERP